MMSLILDDNHLPMKRYTNKAFMAVIFAPTLLLLLYTFSILMMENYFPIPFYSIIAQVISILAIATILFGVFYTIKAILNKEPNDFKKVVAVIGNGFFFLLLLLSFWMFFRMELY